MPVAHQSRSLWDIIFRRPKEMYDLGPRPPLVHPDVIKDREERAKKVKVEQAANNSESVDS